MSNFYCLFYFSIHFCIINSLSNVWICYKSHLHKTINNRIRALCCYSWRTRLNSCIVWISFLIWICKCSYSLSNTRHINFWTEQTKRHKNKVMLSCVSWHCTAAAPVSDPLLKVFIAACTVTAEWAQSRGLWRHTSRDLGRGGATCTSFQYHSIREREHFYFLRSTHFKLQWFLQSGSWLWNLSHLHYHDCFCQSLGFPPLPW